MGKKYNIIYDTLLDDSTVAIRSDCYDTSRVIIRGHREFAYGRNRNLLSKI